MQSNQMPQTRFETHNSLHIAFLMLLVIMYSLFMDQKLIVKSPKRKTFPNLILAQISILTRKPLTFCRIDVKCVVTTKIKSRTCLGFHNLSFGQVKKQYTKKHSSKKHTACIDGHH